jgi:hypothetical protein
VKHEYREQGNAVPQSVDPWELKRIIKPKKTDS